MSEFFTKNRHLLGFDNPAKALLTTVKEAVDNALDACEEAGILPSIRVEIVEMQAAAPSKEGQEAKSSRFRVSIEDNGPGIVRAQIPKIFAKLLYGSKFHRLKQSRGQQGIGISAAGLYGQLTTGKPVLICSKIGKKKPTHSISLRIDTRRNAPDILQDIELDPNGSSADEVYWASIDHGTRVDIELTGTYRAGRTGVDAYLEQTVVANPHLELWYQPPRGVAVHYPRVANELPREAQEIKPHPHGVELGMLLKMMQDAEGKTVQRALQDDFSKVSATLAEAVCQQAGVKIRAKASDLTGEQVERLHLALAEVKIPPPSAACVVPIGETLIIEGMKRRFKAEFFTSATRPPAVYRGNPFVIEVGLAYGGDLPLDESAEVLRFANRVPLQYQPRACAITEGVFDTNWKNYELAQPKGSLPIGPLAIFVHLASVWVPFTSEAKEAVAHYPELLAEIMLGLKEVGRRLGSHLRARSKLQADAQRRSLFERYIPEVSTSLGKLLQDDRGKIDKMFLDALPNFVRMAEEAEPVEEPRAPAGAPTATEAPDEGPNSEPASDPTPKSTAKPTKNASQRNESAKTKPARPAQPAEPAQAMETAQRKSKKAPTIEPEAKAVKPARSVSNSPTSPKQKEARTKSGGAKAKAPHNLGRAKNSKGRAQQLELPVIHPIKR
ncbi:MAG: DNA topoisomerase VI subunit B [Polyangiales bacterium]